MRYLFPLALLLILSGCGKSSDADSSIPGQSGKRTIVVGYNNPPTNQFQNEIGFHAACDGQDLYLSIANGSSAPIVLGPKAFRILFDDRQYAFSEDKHELTLFDITTIPAKSVHNFYVNVSDVPELSEKYIVMNYPPKGVLMRVPIEQVTTDYDLNVDSLKINR